MTLFLIGGAFTLYKPLAAETFRSVPKGQVNGVKSSYLSHLAEKQKGFQEYVAKKEQLLQEKGSKGKESLASEKENSKVEKSTSMKGNYHPIIFNKEPISEELAKMITGASYKANDVIQLGDLSYLQITYWGYDDQTHIGEMIVNEKVADEVLDIFKELYENKYYIEKMRLIDEYNADDNKSMAANNTSAFCYREMTGGYGLSKHSYGLAIDINPVMNPYIHGQEILPPQGKDYVERNAHFKGLIVKGDPCYNAFTKRGWIWGGDWVTPKDYQHFEKNIKDIP